MALEPITRQEKIIAGQDLTPITRMEMFLKNFGGGGGSVPKPLTYDYMPEGYPKKTVQTTVLMEEQEVAFEDDKNIYYGHVADPFDIVIGQTYTVNWDGTEYECAGSAYNEKNFSFIGNLSISGVGNNTGEPFLYVPAGSGFNTPDTSASHTISVKTTVETVTPMAMEFLPSEVDELIMNSSTTNSTKKFKITVNDSGTISATEVT